MKPEELTQAILELKQQRRAVILAHNYQRGEVQELADFCGDSLGLSQQATQTDAELIVFCGVHFMAETAFILNPEKTILLPEPRAGCPLADMITAEDVRRLKAEHPGVPVVCYVNSSAAVKAESDICCTSANAVSVVESLNADTVIFVPDQNLGRYVAGRTGKKIILWPGYCPTHRHIRRRQIEDLKARHPEAALMAHPECEPDVLELADAVCSTSGMYRYARESAATAIIVGSEEGMLYRLRKENPGKRFLLPSKYTICPNMKLTNLEKIYRSLTDLTTVVSLPEEMRQRAEAAVGRMMAL